MRRRPWHGRRRLRLRRLRRRRHLLNEPERPLIAFRTRRGARVAAWAVGPNYSRASLFTAMMNDGQARAG